MAAKKAAISFHDDTILMRKKLHILYSLLIACIFVFAIGFDSHDEAKSACSMKHLTLSSHQIELLEIAFQAASAMPINPHIKDRSRAQESIVKACFELKQPQRALGYIEQIDNWRRGAGYADLALYYAQHEAMKEDLEPFLNKAAQVAEEAEDWRKDHIQVKVDQVNILLRHYQKARVRTDSFDKEMEALEKNMSSGQFDAVKNTLMAYSELFNRFYTDSHRRALIEKKLKAAWGSMPIFVRIDLLIQLTGFALAHSDQTKALKLVGEIESIIESVSLQPRFAIPIKTKLAELRFHAGDRQRARTEAQNALSLFDEEREKIANIYRAQMLRSLAEAYLTMGEAAMALDLYKRAIEAGIENPNSRPRAEDLAATCCAMALHSVEPDAELLSRIRKILDKLGDPW